jgi:tetratricopeptide (TPR) repeat protein
MLDRALEPLLTPLLALLDVPVDDAAWEALDPPQRRQRTLEAVKRLLLRESQVQPLLVIFEDLHWIDSETQALFDSLIESLPTARVLLLVNYRPEYQHGRGGKTYYLQLRIDPLPPESADTLLGALLGEDSTLAPLKRMLIERTEGNPFFLEESVRTLVETAVLVGERGSYRMAKAPDAWQIPATAQAILAARVDRLAPEDKRLLQAASVIGKDVPFVLLQAIAHLEGALTAIGHLPPGRETAEQAIDVRVELRNAIHPLGELERAIDYLTEAMTLSERLGDASRSGSISLLLANNHRMTGHSDRARALLDRALAIAESTDDSLLRLMARSELGYVHHDRGDFRQAAITLREYSTALQAAGAASITLGVSPRIVSITTYLAWSLAELGDFEEARRMAEESLRLAGARENPYGLMLAYMGAGLVHIRQGDAPAAMRPLERGLQVCHTFGLTALAFHGIAASLGAAYALANRCEEAIPLLRMVADQAIRMNAVSDHLVGAIPLAEVYLLTGRAEEADEIATHSLDLARRHGHRGHEVYAHRLLGDVYARRESSEVTAAEAHYRNGLELADSLGMRPLVAHCHLGLGKLYRRTGKREQAHEHLTTATTMYREMDMRFWLEQAESEVSSSDTER